MEEGASDSIRRGDAFQVGSPSLDALLIDALEGIAIRLQATRGRCRIEFEFHDGLFQVGWRHERITQGTLRRFDEEAGVTPAAPA
jgi:hypothetical protein